MNFLYSGNIVLQLYLLKKFYTKFQVLEVEKYNFLKQPPVIYSFKENASLSGRETGSQIDLRSQKKRVGHNLCMVISSQNHRSAILLFWKIQRAQKVLCIYLGGITTYTLHVRIILTIDLSVQIYSYKPE